MELDALIARRNNDAALHRGTTSTTRPVARASSSRRVALVRPARVRDRVERSVLAGPGYDGHLAAFRPREDGDPDRVFGLGVAKCGCNFAPGRGPDQTGHLGRDRDGRQRGTGPGVKEMNALVVGPSSSRNQALLPGTECNGLDCGSMDPSMLFIARAEVSDKGDRALQYLGLRLCLKRLTCWVDPRQRRSSSLVLLSRVLGFMLVSKDFVRFEYAA